LGSCIGTWNKLHESRAGGSALSSNTPPGLWFNNLALALPHPSPVSSPYHLSISSVVQSVGIKASLGFALCHWFLPSRFYLHHWALPSATGFYLPSLGSAPRRWVLPLVVGHCLPPLGCTLCHWALLLWHLIHQCGGPSLSIPLSSIPPHGVVNRHYVSSMGAMPCCWAVGGQ